MAKRFARKVKRAGKTAVQFRFNSTFEYIDLTCNGTWRPEKLRIIWLRSQRRVQSSEIEFVVTEDRGPNGADGRAVFDPPISASLIVTLYKEAKKNDFEEKEYKYYIEHEDKTGKKILASFNCDMAEYAGIPSSRHALEMNFKSVSRKISKAVLGITLESTFIKEGKDTDDDMQSTFSAVDPGQSMLYADDEDDIDDDDLDEAATLGMRAARETTPDKTKTPSPEPGDETDQQGPPPVTDQVKEPEVPPPETASPSRTEPQPISATGELIRRWLPDPQIVDLNDVALTTERLDSADVIGLYFSAQWCPPCRRFLPKLMDFYKAVKSNGKSFELVYVSNDNSRAEMIQYMQEQQMPWVAIPHGNPLIDKLKVDFKVRSIPLLVVVAANGDVLDENAKKAIENCHSAASSSIKQYLKWAELYDKDEEVKQKTGILSSLKKALTKDSPEREQPPPQPNQEQELRESAESKVHKILLNERQNKEELLQKLQEKEDIIRHLQEVNQSLKHTNDELNTEIRTIKTTLEVSETRVKELEETTAQKKVEDAKFKEFLAVQGWLFKKGIKGPTANVYRKRYFRLDQGSKLYYYKSQSEGQPQGYIDLLKVVNVSAADSASQDKNNASFNIDCEGRTYQLQSYDQSDMKRWINALNYLKDYYRNKAAAK